MDPLLSDIVDAFASHGAQGVRADDGFRQLVADHAGDTGFDAAVNLVTQIAEPLERTLKDQTHQHQVRMALVLFYRCRKKKDLQTICRELTRRRFAPRWSDKQRLYYEEASEKLEHWQDYFLSFTNYTPAGGGVMYVNNQHRVMISLGLGRTTEPVEMEEKNLLALMLHYELRHAALRGFYYPDARHRDEVRTRLQQEARSALVFVQLLQNSMFEKDPNYCLEEFEAATEDGARDLVFVMTIPRAEFVRSEEIELHMLGWHETIMSRPPIELESTIDEARAWEQLTKMRTELVEFVKAARKRLYENVPL